MVVMAIALLGTVSLAGAGAVTAVSFTPGSTVANATSTWTVVHTEATALAAAGTITVVLPSGFTIPSTPTITLGTGFTSCTATAATTGQSILITLAGVSCASTVGANSLTIAGITNGGAGVYAASGFTVKTSADSTAGSPSTAITLTGAIGTPTATNAGSGLVNVAFNADNIATTYTVNTVGGTTAQTCVVASANPIATGSWNCTVSGLTNGTSYTFTVTPSGNSDTNTVSLASNSVAPGAILATPTALLAGSGAVNISFTADGAATLYTVAATATSQTTQYCYVGTGSVLTGTQNCTVTGLTNSTAYTFTVTPSGGTSSTHASSVTATPLATTGSAPIVTNTGGGYATATFAADGTGKLYTVTATPSAGTASTCYVGNGTTALVGLQTCTLSGIINGNSYTSVAITEAPATTTYLTNTTFVGSTALSTPTVTNVAPGAVKVSFTADGVSTVYQVTSNPSVTGSTCSVTNTQTPPTGAQSCVVTGLAGNTSYTFTVTPSGSANSSAAATSTSITTLKYITATATAGTNNTATVTFNTDGVATNYLVTSTPGNLTCSVVYATTAIPASGTSANCVVTGLTAGTSYTFVVAASGNGTVSGTSAATTAITAGAALSTPVATNVGGRSVSVAFTADGTSTLYTVQAYGTVASAGLTTGGSAISGAVCYVGNSAKAPTGAQSCTVPGTGLNNLSYYYFIVTPTGGSSSAATAPSIQVTSALSQPTVTNAGSGAIKVAFVADGTATAYLVQTASGSPSGSCVVVNTATPPTGAQSCVVTGLTNGSSYTFTVTPSGGSTLSTVSVASNSIMAGVSFLATPTITWAADGAAAVTFAADGVASTYTVQAYTAAAPTTALSGFTCTVANSTTPPKGTQTCTISGLTDGTSYVFDVTPSGNGTTSLVSAKSAAFTPSVAVAPAAPTAVAATGTGSSLKITWTAPAVTGGSAITGYVVSATAGNVTTSCGTVAATATSCTITGLLANTSYTLSVAAVNALGTSPVATGTASTSGAASGTNLHTTGAHGFAVVGRTVVITITGGGFYGQPKLTSNAAGVRAVVIKDNGTMLTVRVTTSATRARGWHTFTITLANGKMAKVNYLTK
jgi:hypothetical protein